MKKEDRDEDLIDADLHDSDFLDLETGELVNEKSPLISSQPHYDDGRRRYDDARRIVQEDVHHRRRLRVAFVRTLIYSAIVMLMVHAVVVIQRGLTE